MLTPDVTVADGAGEGDAPDICAGRDGVSATADGAAVGTDVTAGETVMVDVRVGLGVAVGGDVIVTDGGTGVFCVCVSVGATVRDGMVVVAASGRETCARGLADRDNGHISAISISRMTAPACQPGWSVDGNSFMAASIARSPAQPKIRAGGGAWWISGSVAPYVRIDARAARRGLAARALGGSRIAFRYLFFVSRHVCWGLF